MPAAAADAVAVVPDDDPSTSGQDAHTKDVTRLPLATGPCSGGINNGSLRRRGPSQPAAGGADTDCAEGGGVAGATFQETHAEVRWLGLPGRLPMRVNDCCDHAVAHSQPQRRFCSATARAF